MSKVRLFDNYEKGHDHGAVTRLPRQKDDCNEFKERSVIDYFQFKRNAHVFQVDG